MAALVVFVEADGAHAACLRPGTEFQCGLYPVAARGRVIVRRGKIEPQDRHRHWNAFRNASRSPKMVRSTISIRTSSGDR